LWTRAGGAADPPGKDGLAFLTAQTLEMGTDAHAALELEEALSDLGADLSASAGRESSLATLEVLKRNLPAAMTLLAEVVERPTFPGPEIERERDRHLDNLEQQARNAGAVASRVRSMLAFGADHPYGKPLQGLPSTVATLTREDLQRFHDAYYRPASSALVLVGDLTLAEATALARQAFGSWSGGSAPAIEIPAPRPAAPGKIYLVDRQDAAQSMISLFLPAPPRRGPDFDALRLTDSVWGGGASNRLNLNLREDKGYSYGVFSNLQQYREGGLWYAGGGVQTAKTAASVVEFDKELRAIAGGRPISAAEFEGARLKLVRGYAQEFEAFQQVASQIGLLWTWGLPMDELQAQSDRLAEVSLQQAQAVAARFARPEASSLLVVGDRRAIEAGLAELHAGEIVALDAEGRPAH
jgi:zinc protease